MFEARYGIEVLAAGQCKTELTQRFAALLQVDLENRIAVLDPREAAHAAELFVERKARGSAVDIRNTLIAGIAMAHSATPGSALETYFIPATWTKCSATAAQ